MIQTVLTFIMWVAGLFGFGQKDERDISHDQGEDQGKAEVQRDAAKVELQDVQVAHKAEEKISLETSLRPESIKDDDGFRRD